MANTILQLDYGLPTLNDIITASKSTRRTKGSFYSGYTTMKKKFTTKIADELIAQGCVPDTPYEIIRLSIIWTESAKKRDPDNVVAGKKFILDAMVKAKVIPDDTRDYVAGFGESFAISKARRVDVRIEVVSDEC